MCRRPNRKGELNSASPGAAATHHARSIFAFLQVLQDFAKGILNLPADLRAMRLFCEGLDSTIKEHYARKGNPYGHTGAGGDRPRWPKC